MAGVINFIDDDDLVPEDYVATILPLLDGVDYIGHRIQFYLDGALDRPIFHSLKYHGWTTVGGVHYRDISHVNPMRRELALAVPMEGGVAEDFRWAANLRATGLVKTEHYIDRAMYLYYFRTNKDGQPAPPQENVNDARLDEIERAEKVLSWINSMSDHFKSRRAEIDAKTPNLEFNAKDARLDEVRLIGERGFDIFPVQTYIKQRQKEISGL